MKKLFCLIAVLMTLSGLVLTDLLLGPGADPIDDDSSSIGLTDQAPDPPRSQSQSRGPNRRSELQQFIHPAE